jgi:hypothetical protein
VSPIAAAIVGFRQCVLRGELPNVRLLGVHLVVGLLALVGAVRYTAAIELRVADVI